MYIETSRYVVGRAVNLLENYTRDDYDDEEREREYISSIEGAFVFHCSDDRANDIFQLATVH